MDKKYYSCDEIAKMYGVKKSTVWFWIRNGKLKAITVGRFYRVRQQDLESFERQNTNN